MPIDMDKLDNDLDIAIDEAADTVDKNLASKIVSITQMSASSEVI